MINCVKDYFNIKVLGSGIGSLNLKLVSLDSCNHYQTKRKNTNPKNENLVHQLADHAQSSVKVNGSEAYSYEQKPNHVDAFVNIFAIVSEQANHYGRNYEEEGVRELDFFNWSFSYFDKNEIKTTSSSL